MSNSDFQGNIKVSYQDSTPWWSAPATPPEGSPNVLYVLLDDLGFSQLGCYGSNISTPNIDGIAKDGLKFNNFNVTALCSPSRASLLTGCNHHAVGMGFLANDDLGFPNCRGVIDKQYGLISEILHEYGYSTFALGKWHLTPYLDQKGSGSFEHWPLRMGFDRFYGFLGACTHQFAPALVYDNHFISQPKSEKDGYHLSEDITDKAIEFIGDQKSNDPDKPFFCYLAYGATHSPHHAPKEFIDRYKGKFDQGWDKVREEWFVRQKELGIIPADTELTPRNELASAWDSLSEGEKRIYARYMEVFAGFLEHTDYHIGRLISYLKEINQYENTMIVFLSDNGASGEGGPRGSFNDLATLVTDEFEELMDEQQYDDMGSTRSYTNYPLGWANAGNTPLKWYKSWVHAGGVQVPLIISYPKKIVDEGSIRTQYHHISDLTPTVLDVLGLEKPNTIKGVPQKPLHGISMKYTFDSPKAPTQKKVQHYEMCGNRGIWSDGWKAVASHIGSNGCFENDKWELYHVLEDFSEMNDLAEKYPDKLQELIALWWHEAGVYGVLPMLESWFRKNNNFKFHQILRFVPIKAKTNHIYYPQMSPKTVACSPVIRNKSFTITADVERKSELDEGVLVSAGGRFAGYVLYIKNNKLIFDFNNLQKHNVIISSDDLPSGKLILSFAFTKTKEGAGVGRLLVNDKIIGMGRLENTQQMSGYGQFYIGRNETTPVGLDYETPFKFSGDLKKVEYILDTPDDYQLNKMIALEEELLNE